MGQVLIASRTYYKLNNKKTVLKLEVYKPLLNSDTKMYECVFKFIGAPEGFEGNIGYGEDSMSALLRALALLKSFLETINSQHFGDELRWLEDADSNLWFDIDL